MQTKKYLGSRERHTARSGVNGAMSGLRGCRKVAATQSKSDVDEPDDGHGENCGPGEWLVSWQRSNAAGRAVWLGSQATSSQPHLCYFGGSMKVARQLGIVILLLVLSLAPAMACLIHGATMTAGERACCQTMSAQCGRPDMPASHSCCRGTLPVAGERAIDAKVSTVHLAAVATIPLAVWDMMAPVLPASARIGYTDSSLPGSPPSSISVLRI